MSKRWFKWVSSVAIGSGLLAGAATGCELIAAVDRNEIPTPTGGSTPVGPGGGGTDPVGPGGAGGAGGGPACDGEGGDQGCDADTDCATFECVDEMCEQTNTAAMTACTDAGNTNCDESADECLCDGMGDCVPANCMDGVLNSDETDVDCGGSCNPCDNDDECLVAADCNSGYCAEDLSGGGGTGGGGGAGVGGAAGGAGGAAGGAGIGGAGGAAGGAGGAAGGAGVGGAGVGVGGGGGSMMATLICQACADENDCGTDEFCDTTTAGGTCTAQKADGEDCTDATSGIECTSGNCVDDGVGAENFVCCDTACDGGCNACLAANGASADGTCTVVGDMEAGADVCGAFLCQGNGTTTSAPCETSCDNDDANCDGITCTDDVCCNVACDGDCEACDAVSTGGVDGTCAPVLQGGTDPGTCDTATDCAAASSCACDGAATPACKLGLGEACGTDDALCASGQCTDGVCCDAAACTDDCSSCAVSGSEGTCQPLGSGATDAADENQTCGANVGDCSGDAAADCTCNGSSGAGSCVTIQGQECAADGECFTNECADGVCCTTDACAAECESCAVSGSEGTCQPVGSGATDAADDNQTCGANAGDCTGDDAADCACDGSSGAGSCVTIQGQECTANGDCLSDSCVDDDGDNAGVCCDTPCDQECDVCETAGGATTAGTCDAGGADADFDDDSCGANNVCNGSGSCLLADGQDAMGAGANCASGIMEDGVCCAAACGTCEVCDVSGDGTCTPIDNNTDPDNECANGCCDGASACGTNNCNNGVSCSAAGDCTSGFCPEDGVCCDEDCDTACESCNAMGMCNQLDGDDAGVCDDASTAESCATTPCECAAGVCLEDLGQACSETRFATGSTPTAPSSRTRSTTPRLDSATSPSTSAMRSEGPGIGRTRRARSTSSKYAWGRCVDRR